jgi:hypothetical protein
VFCEFSALLGGPQQTGGFAAVKIRTAFSAMFMFALFAAAEQQQNESESISCL